MHKSGYLQDVKATNRSWCYFALPPSMVSAENPVPDSFCTPAFHGGRISLIYLQALKIKKLLICQM